jgi:predicted enzyme related to lactoylglutathione lyase
MSERTAYPHGTPSWVDIGVPDLDAAAAFYEGLFGWTVDRSGPPEAGGYAMCLLEDRPVAGMGPQVQPEIPPYWAVYVTVDDADAALAAAEANGGGVLAPAFDVMTFGRMGIISDPAGAVISVWQPIDHIGAHLVNEPGTFCWNELGSSDLAAVRPFYAAVFGWGEDESSSSEGSAIFTVGGRVTCGAHQAGEGEPNAWSAWFAVADCDASTDKAVELGATVLMPPNDMDFGRGSMVMDPNGAVIGLGDIGEEDPL